MRGTRRFATAAGAALVLGGFLATPGGAQSTTETITSFAAESASAGFGLFITPPEGGGLPVPAGASAAQQQPEPAVSIQGAASSGEINSDPSAQGLATLFAVNDASPALVQTEAPPNEADSAASPVPAINIPGVGDIAAFQGEASSRSAIAGGDPETENDAGFTAIEIEVAALDLPEPLGQIGVAAEIAAASTFANSSGDFAGPGAFAEAGHSGILIELDLTVEVLGTLCEQLPEGQLRDACNALIGGDEDEVPISVNIAPSQVSCQWDGEEADCDGEAATAEISILGQETTIAPGESVALPPDGPFLVRASAGNFSEELDNNGADSGSAVASGISIELLGADPAAPGLITFNVGQSTAGVAGEITEDEIIARTGAPVLPVLFGGSAMIAAGLGLRRFLKRR
jgi:hypothetical protein